MSAALSTNLAGRMVIFRVDEHRYGLSLDAVVHIVRAAEVTPLANAPGIVLGIIDIGGRVVPVLDLRKRLHLPPRDLHPSDHFIIAQAGPRTVALIADETEEVAEIPTSEILNTSEIVPGLEYLSGVARLPSGLVLIHDLETFLSQEEAHALDSAMKV